MKEPDSAIELCEDPDCPAAWAYKDPPREHYHPRPHGPRVDQYESFVKSHHESFISRCLICGTPGRILCEAHR